MKTQIQALDDLTAIHLLTTIAQSRLRTGDFETTATPELQTALTAQFDTQPPDQPATAGDLARDALTALAETPEFEAPLTAMLNGPKAQRFTPEPVTTVALIAAALFALQTHVKIERDKTGKYTFLLEKKPTKDALLKPLVKKILSLFP